MRLAKAIGLAAIVCVAFLGIERQLSRGAELTPPDWQLLEARPAEIVDTNGQEYWFVTVRIRNTHSDPNAAALYIRYLSTENNPSQESAQWVNRDGYIRLPSAGHHDAILLTPHSLRSFRVQYEYTSGRTVNKIRWELATRTSWMLGLIPKPLAHGFWRWIGHPYERPCEPWRRVEMPISI